MPTVEHVSTQPDLTPAIVPALGTKGQTVLQVNILTILLQIMAG